MLFNGIGKVFSTEENRQFETIGTFWDEMSGLYGRSNLRGLGFNWADNTIEYVIGLKDGVIPGTNRAVILPDEGWITVQGKTSDLDKIYERIYRDGALKYEIEMFDDQGDCIIQYCR